MKTCKSILCMLFILSSVSTFAQAQEKAKALFAQFPQTIQLSDNILDGTIKASAGEEVIIAFSRDFRFRGTVISNESRYANMQTVLIRSEAFDNAVFQLSRISNDDKTYSYSGRIMQATATDGYEVKKDANNAYCIQKIETSRIMEPCSH